MDIKHARYITGYEKQPFYEYSDGGVCDYCHEKFTKLNSANEKRTSFEYEEYNVACNNCVKSMAFAIESGVDLVVGMF